ncbi:hypothetical protein [Streptomyces sp. NPDC001165]|uniref:hypothetical protein n=1 Tax=Streptomyces sp. NPDC001165 TaxID=3364546 RepID=UPI0036CB68CD
MSTELGQLFDISVDHIRASRALALSRAHTPALLTDALEVLVQLDVYTRELRWDADTEGGPPTIMETATADLRSHLAQATAHLAIAARLAPAQSAAVPTPLREAQKALTASRDLLHTHRGPDRQLLTPYALLLARAGAQHYLARRVTDVTWELSRLFAELAGPDETPSWLTELLQDARRALEQATVLGRAGAQGAADETGALPAAGTLLPIPHTPDETPADSIARLEEASEQLLRAGFDASRTSTEPPTGTDLPQLARSLAMTRLLSAQLLAHAFRDGATTTLVADLGTAARAWHRSAETWHHVVDLNDPSAHPLLPPYGYLSRRRGQASPLPQPRAAHPACQIAATMALRTGRLLYGPAWQPHSGTSSRARQPLDALLADAGGERLLHALYRMSTAGRFLAASLPTLVERSAATLVTDSLEHRPTGTPDTVRFYPAHHRQLEQITDQYRTIGIAEDSLCTRLIHHAQAAGRPIVRAGLDNAITGLYPPAPPTLSRRQEEILDRIVADSQQRTAQFTAAAARRTQPAQAPRHQQEPGPARTQHLPGQ